MAKRKGTKGQTTIYETLHKKLIKLATSIDSNVPLENLSSSRILPSSTIICL
jgi:hypothetical protein